MSSKAKAKERTLLLKRLREQHRDTVERTQALLKEQKAIRRQICQAVRDSPQTVPEIAKTIGLPADQVLWHITAMRKYGDMAEAGMCGEYYLYEQPQEIKK